jgi:hypothetical protein
MQLMFYGGWSGADDIATALAGPAALYAKAYSQDTAKTIAAYRQIIRGTVARAIWQKPSGSLTLNSAGRDSGSAGMPG